MNYLCRRVLFVLTATLGLATAARAQTNDLVPRELALALLGQWRGFVDYSSLLVGRAPEYLPTALIPAGTTILGSLVYDDASTIVLTSPENSPAAQKLVEEHLKANGWVPGPRIVPRGFVPGSVSAMMGPLCNADRAAVIAAFVRATGGALVTMHFTTSQGGLACRDEASRPPWSEELPIPALFPPPGLTSEYGTGGASGDEVSDLQTRLHGRGAAGDILRHYVDQLIAAEWIGGPRAAADGVATQSMSKIEDGAIWQASLSVLRTSDTSSDVMLHLRRRNSGN